MYRVRILDAAVRELERLDKSIGRRIVKRINWLAENLENIKLEALSGDLAGLFKLRVGSYRVLFEIVEEEQLVIIHKVGHRKDVYRNL